MKNLLFEEFEMSDEEKKYYSLSKKYREKFGSYVAREMMPAYISTQMLMEMMEEAIKTGDNNEIKRYEEFDVNGRMIK